jgi:putative nucleotidyltransferase with HDIG domain
MLAAQKRTVGEVDLEATIVELVARGEVKVPPYPAVAMRIGELVRREDYGIGDLARLVASDQVLAADALRAANSAFYSRGTPVTSLNTAISRIGGKEVVRLAVASGLGGQVRKSGPLLALKRRVWLEAIAAAALAQELAKKRKVPDEEAFICALLHDFGKMIALTCIEEILDKQPAVKPRRLEHWLETTERFHVELGLVLAAQWRLPPLVSDVISLHHGDPSAAADARMVEIVAATDEVLGLLSDHIWLTAEELGTVKSLAPAECELVSRVVDRLPDFVASFEVGAAAPSPSQSLIAAEAPEAFAAGPTSVSFPVDVVVNRNKVRYAATAIAPKNLVVRGTAPLPENVLMELSLGSLPPLTCWGTAKLSWSDKGAYAVLLQPFAMSAGAQAAWKELAKRTIE